jgi:MtN3 and saliva related transmembrane protein
MRAATIEIEDLVDTRLVATILGAIAATSSTVAFVPQITKIWKTGGKDVSYFMLSLYVAGVTLWLCYGLVIGANALSFANAASILFAGACLVLKRIKENQAPGQTAGKRLRIAIDMDETIADSLREHIRRYNSAFAEKIAPDDLYGKHLEEFAPLDRSEAVRRMVRDESFFDGLNVIQQAQQVIRELGREHEVFTSCRQRWKFRSHSRQNTGGYRDISRSFQRGVSFSVATKESLMPIT